MPPHKSTEAYWSYPISGGQKRMYGGRHDYYHPSREVVDERRRVYEASNWEPHWMKRAIQQWERVLQKTEERAEAWERVRELSAHHIERLGIEAFQQSRETLADVSEAQAAYDLADRRVHDAVRHLKRCESPESLDRRQIPRPVRREVLQRWEEEGRICAVCGEKVPAGGKVHLQHKRPVWNGGDSYVCNLSVAHACCNAKSDIVYHRPFGRGDDLPRLQAKLIFPRLESDAEIPSDT